MRLSSPARAFPLERLSASSLGLFAACPEQFRQKYIVGRPDVSFGDRFMGSVNHETISFLLNCKKEAPDILAQFDDDKIRELTRQTYRDRWEAKLEEQGEPDWKDQDPVEMYGRGMAMAMTYIDQAVPSITPLAVEERIELKLPKVPLIVGFVDVIEADKIRERKTTRAKETKPKSKWLFQGRIYQLVTGMPVEFDVLTRQVEPKLWTVNDYPDLRMELVSRTNTTQMIYDLYNRMVDLWERRGPHFSWPLDGYHDPWICGYCPIGPRYGATCAAWS